MFGAQPAEHVPEPLTTGALKTQLPSETYCYYFSASACALHLPSTFTLLLCEDHTPASEDYDKLTV
jgi:hypothetical protein